jgi:hypothetical protein
VSASTTAATRGPTNGGARLKVEGPARDLLYRDLDAVRRRRDDGEAGRYAVDWAEGYLGGMANYVLAGELPREGWRASRPGRSFATRCAGSRRRAGRRSAAFSLAIADAAAERHDVVTCAGLLAKAASRRPGGSSSGAECALNEQGIVRRAGVRRRCESRDAG